MKRKTPSLRAVGALVLVALLAACSTGTSTSADSSGAADAADVVTIEHKFGTTEIPADPQRVVTVGWNDQDFVLALGVIPVATRAWFDDYNSFPWVVEATDGAGVEAIEDLDGINFEAVAAADPDVIFAIYEAIDEPTYARLSEIAPTVVQSGEYANEQTPWDAQLLLTGRALGKPDEAQALVDRVSAEIDRAVAENPEFAGKVLVEDYGPEDGGHYLIGAGDPRRTLVDALGFAAQDEVGDLSQELLAALDRDVLFVFGATREEMLQSPGFDRLDVVTQDRTLYTTFDSPLAGALSYSGPYAMLYALDVLVPQLANAVNGRPVADLADA